MKKVKEEQPHSRKEEVNKSAQVQPREEEKKELIDTTVITIRPNPPVQA